MTPTSHSRGILYSAPPTESTANEEPREEDTSLETEEKEATQISPGTEANWTGAVSADD
ncbi:hypothetical protein [Haladaptatus caseinilyticus]|uniref:hypothetical protein n=1 Tax=Haladaptatus caseinilyticus TaxID=2993314 RepID=UPI00224B4C09|nr:hypothetical protein [Haladaptatus caseinilyticus]